MRRSKRKAVPCSRKSARIAVTSVIEYLTALGPAIGAHGGPGMLVVGLQEYTSPGISS